MEHDHIQLSAIFMFTSPKLVCTKKPHKIKKKFQTAGTDSCVRHKNIIQTQILHTAHTDIKDKHIPCADLKECTVPLSPAPKLYVTANKRYVTEA